MVFLTIAVLCLILLSVIAFWLYYVRTKRLLNHYRDAVQTATSDAFLRIENRLVHGMPQYAEQPNAHNPWGIVFTYNRKKFALRTLQTLREHEPQLPILAIDNGSTDGTREELLELLTQGRINKVLFNQHEEVPQWQKSFAINQALMLLSMERPSHIVWMDDDLEIQRPFVSDAIELLDRLGTSEQVHVITMTDDEAQERNHPALKTISVDLPSGTASIKIRATFNGALNLFATDFFREFGPPPIGEGIRNFAGEDWYYSRRLQSMDYRAAVFVAASHAGAAHSKREELERAMLRD